MPVDGFGLPVAPAPRVVKPVAPQSENPGGSRPVLSESQVQGGLRTAREDILTLSHEMAGLPATPSGSNNFPGVSAMMNDVHRQNLSLQQQLQRFTSPPTENSSTPRPTPPKPPGTHLNQQL